MTLNGVQGLIHGHANATGGGLRLRANENTSSATISLQPSGVINTNSEIIEANARTPSTANALVQKQWVDSQIATRLPAGQNVDM